MSRGALECADRSGCRESAIVVIFRSIDWAPRSACAQTLRRPADERYYTLVTRRPTGDVQLERKQTTRLTKSGEGGDERSEQGENRSAVQRCCRVWQDTLDSRVARRLRGPESRRAMITMMGCVDPSRLRRRRRSSPERAGSWRWSRARSARASRGEESKRADRGRLRKTVTWTVT